MTYKSLSTPNIANDNVKKNNWSYDGQVTPMIWMPLLEHWLYFRETN